MKKLNLKQNKILKTVILSVIVIILILVAVNIYVLGYSSKYIKSIDTLNTDDIDCIFVLGAGVKDDKPSLILQLRLDKAIECYQADISEKMLFSGDHGRIDYDEVNIMKAYSEEKGISPDAIYLDHAGFSTYESMYRAKEVFGVNKVVIITQKYHLSRAIYIARKLGIEAYGIPAEYIVSYGNIKRDFRESIARFKDFLNCIFKPLPKYLGDPISLDGPSYLTDG